MSKPGYILIIVISLFSLLFAGIICAAPTAKAQSDLIIYNVHTNSPRIVKDDGSIEFADYVCIRNISDHTYDLAGLFLSDSRNKLQKLPLDGIIIEAGTSQMIKLDPSWNFALKRTGDEKVYLSDSGGTILFCYRLDMKPAPPQLSDDSGFYDDEFNLEISVKGDYTVYYTLDGSEPDADSYMYTEPIHVYDRSGESNSIVNVPNTIKNYYDEGVIDSETGEYEPVEQPIEEPVDKAFVIRAVAMDEYGTKSDMVTREYFFCGDKYKNVMSIVADRDDLFGEHGILSTGSEYDEWYINGKEGEQPSVNFHQKGRDWEVPAAMDYFRSGERVLSQKCGLKLQGRTTRDRRIKNFQLRARKSYSGSDVFEYDFFDNEPYRSDGIVLDENFRESFFLALVENEKIIKQKTTDRVALFVNGEFWNNIYIRQRIDERYFEDHYNIEPDNLIVLSESFPEIGADSEEEGNRLSRMYATIDEFASNNDLSIRENYDKIQKMMDIDSYIDYVAINACAGNTDWGEYNNDMYWRVKQPDGTGYGDGRFRWIIHDGDYVFNKDFKLENNKLLFDNPLFPALMNNEEFRQKLSDRLEELSSTVFSQENVKKVIETDKWDEPELSEFVEFFGVKRNDDILLIDGNLSKE